MAEAIKRANHSNHHMNGEPPARRAKGWSIPASEESKGAINSIRLCEELHFKDALRNRNKDLDLIKLSIGDPTVFGNLPPDPVVEKAITEAVASGKYNGYGHSKGLPHVRKVLAEKFSVINKAPLTSEDVILTNACSGALDLCINVLANAGQNILVPKPGFALYKCLTGAMQVEMRSYKLKPHQQWEVDIEDMERLVDSNTVAILINNPSNPCGSVFSLDHLKEIVDFAVRHKLPIISDEIYADMVFTGQKFHSLGALGNKVPVLVCGGMAKRFLLPGWRIGWVLIHDYVGAFANEIREGLDRLAMKLLGPSTIQQAAIPSILNDTPDSFHARNIAVFEENAKLVYEGLSSIPGLDPIMPSGTMYLMVGIDVDKFPGISNDIDFTKQLLLEQSVFCLPGEAFQIPNFFRVVLVMPQDKIQEACLRIANFCKAHYSQ